jgi:hypothetical protein
MSEEKKDPLWLVGLPGGMFLVGRADGPPDDGDWARSGWIGLKDPLMVFEVPNRQKPDQMMFGMKPFLFAAPFPALCVRPVILQLISGAALDILEPAYERSLVAERAQRAGIIAPDEQKIEDPTAGGVFRRPQ